MCFLSSFLAAVTSIVIQAFKPQNAELSDVGVYFS